MGLVDYSDSDESETEQTPVRPERPEVAAKDNVAPVQSKSGFQKVVDKSNPHRIRVELPDSSRENFNEEKQYGEDRPVKKARTTGAFGGFNSFLPAPKNASKQPADGSAPSSLLKGRPTGLRPGISLKTGATPAFSREVPKEVEEEPTWDVEEAIVEPPHVENGVGYDSEQGHSLPEAKHDMKPAAKPMMFKPLSVGRKNPKKKKPPPTEEQNKTTAGDESGKAPDMASIPPKPKRSLFSSLEQEDPEVPSAANSQYEPLLEETNGGLGGYGEEEHVQSSGASGSAIPLQKSQQPSDLSALADSLGLTPAQRRQLFGRNESGKGAAVAHFSVSAEYSSNNDLLANEANAIPAHNPVRSIAPGKHSLQQLLNAATSQKDALEEHFATGKRNKADAGSRYGW